MALPRGFRITMDFDDATWGQLRRLVELAKDVPDDAPIEYDWTGRYLLQDDIAGPDGIVVTIEGE